MGGGRPIEEKESQRVRENPWREVAQVETFASRMPFSIDFQFRQKKIQSRRFKFVELIELKHFKCCATGKREEFNNNK